MPRQTTVRRPSDGTAYDGPLVNLNARVSRHLWRRVRLQCARDGRLLREFITEALREHLAAEQRAAERRR